MVTKAKILQEISNAKVAHERWVKRAEHLVEGLPVSKSFIPLDTTECGFGQWLYSEAGNKLRLTKEFKNIIEQIEFYHDQVHDVYKEIYKIYFVLPNERSLMHKIITLNSKKISKHEKERALEAYRELKKVSFELRKLLDKMEMITRNTETFFELNNVIT